MATKPNHRPRRRWLHWRFVLPAITITLIVAVVAVFATGNGAYVFPFLYPTMQVENFEAGEGVSVTGRNVPVDIGVSLTDQPLPLGTIPDQTSATDPSPIVQNDLVYSIEPTGPLLSPMTVRIPRTPSSPDAIPLVLANFSHQPGDWQVLPGARYEGDSVVFETTHLSFFHVEDIIERVVRETFHDVLDELTAGAAVEAEEPECDNENRAVTNSYRFAERGSLDATLVCYGYEGTDRVIKVTNARRYPVEVETTGNALPAIDTGDVPVSITESYRLNHLVIMPRATMTFAVNPMDPGATATLDTRITNWGVGLQIVDVAAKIIVLLAARIGLGSSEQLLRSVMQAALSYQECQVALESNDPNLPAIVNKCFNNLVLGTVFNIGAAAVVGAIALVFATLDTGRAFLNAVGDNANGRGNFGIDVRRGVVPTEFVGEWTNDYGDHHIVVVNADGSGRLQSYCVPSVVNCNTYDGEMSFALDAQGGLNGIIVTAEYGGLPTGRAPEPELNHAGDEYRYYLDADNLLHLELLGRVADLRTYYEQGSQVYCGPTTADSVRSACLYGS